MVFLVVFLVVNIQNNIQEIEISDDEIQKVASNCLNKEIEGLESLRDVLNDNVTLVVKEILKTKGRVIVSGIGKSGYIAKKISASLASTGTPSFFLHPAEAIHGDLGMVTQEDIVILLSNSGETAEITPIIDYCKRFNIRLVGLCRKKNSVLDKASDISVVLPNVLEASDINAPTTSATMMLVYGDIITVCLHKMRNFTKEDFNVYHPGGNLGARLKKVSDLMHTGDEMPVVFANNVAMDAIIEMTSKRLGCVAIIDNKDNSLMGAITDGDLRRHIEVDFNTAKASDIMTKDPFIVSEDSYATEALLLMEKKAITQVFVQKNGDLVGVIHMHDLLRSGIV